MHRIFIVEDDESIATAIKSQVESWGCEAQRVQDFRNVLSECIAYQPHLVLMDIALPFFNGYHWCSEIRRHSKVQALLRRTYDFSSHVDLLEHRGIVLNRADASVSYSGERLDLTKNEYRILQVLFENRGKVVRRDTLMERLWETDCFVDENTLSVNMARLRKKLELVGIEDLVRTKKGVGYIVE